MTGFTLRRWATRIGCLLVCAPALAPLPAQQPGGAAPPVEWTAYGRDPGGSKYSPAAQVTRRNVKQLVPAWTYRTGDYARGDGATRDETTPLYVDGRVFVSTPFGGVRALDPHTGAELWSFDSELDLSGSYGDFTNRGVSTWADSASRVTAACHRRIYVATIDARLIALDARTGRRCRDFGRDGTVDMHRAITNEPRFKGEFAVTSPPAVFRDLLIVGSTVADNQRVDAPSGTVRAFDARTGALRWSWDPIPRDPADPGHATWKSPSGLTTGAANAWSVISVDAARDLVFVPTGSASPDFFGGERLGANLYSNSVVALRASTGAMVWHYQMVHHDLWDYDAPAEPALVTVRHDGREIPAVVETTKMGFVFVLDRETGRSLFPVEEHAVPSSDVPGEQAWPTQPFPLLPAPLGPTAFDPATPFGISDSSRAWCREELSGVRSDGIFTPPSLRGTVIFPGNIGGSNWSGAAIDPVRHLALIPSNRIITVVELIPRARLEGRAMGGTRFDEFAPQAGTSFGLRRRHLIAADGVPCNAPPWGVLTAIDLETGAKRWERPFGSIPAVAAVPGSARWGSPNLGGAMATAGGLIFAAGAVDQTLYAFDVETGEQLWSATLPAGVHGSPMTYTTASGQQFIVVAAGGHKELRDRLGDYIVAFALPSARNRPPGSHRSTAVSTGDYAGHIILDRTRLPISLHVDVDHRAAHASFATTGLRVNGSGDGHVTTDSLVIDAKWVLSPQGCSGTIQLRGTTANDGRDLIGELEYFDGCSGQRTKPGTFALRRLVVSPKSTVQSP